MIAQGYAKKENAFSAKKMRNILDRIRFFVQSARPRLAHRSNAPVAQLDRASDYESEG